jgi:hypothetical protein
MANSLFKQFWSGDMLAAHLSMRHRDGIRPAKKGKIFSRWAGFQNRPFSGCDPQWEGD